MIRSDKFLISQRPYAVDLASLRADEHGIMRLDAAWFRRRGGVTVACAGSLWDVQRPEPVDVAEFLTRHDDGRYGGDCAARWDGAKFWSSEQDPAVSARHLEMLRAMLAAYPAVPAGHSGWWRF